MKLVILLQRLLHSLAVFLNGKLNEKAIANIKEVIEGWFEVIESNQSYDLSKLIEVAI